MRILTALPRILFEKIYRQSTVRINFTRGLEGPISLLYLVLFDKIDYIYFYFYTIYISIWDDQINLARLWLSHKISTILLT